MNPTSPALIQVNGALPAVGGGNGYKNKFFTWAVDGAS